MKTLADIPTSPLTAKIAVQIVDLIRASKWKQGTRLVERKLAEQLKVSRSPVRSALVILEQKGLIKGSAGGGFEVIDIPVEEDAPLEVSESSEEQLYRRLADDRLDGLLAERVSESELQRRYDVGRGELHAVLRRIASEGWMERLPGHGWQFLPTLTSEDAYRKSFQFRATMEPAAILLDTFELNKPAIELRRQQQMLLVGGDIWSVTTSALFDLNVGFHEEVMACSNNPFFMDSFRRLNTLRRLIEYRHSVDRVKAAELCKEHVQLASLLLDGDRQAASFYMQRHLTGVRSSKSAESNNLAEVAR